MSGYIDVELDAHDSETGKPLLVYVSGEIDMDVIFLEVEGKSFELKASDLKRAVSYVEQ